jgi:HlyD family secretion protein
MENQDLLKMKIDKKKAVVRPRRRKKFLYWTFAVILAILVVFLLSRGVLSPTVQVQVATVTQIFPSQGFTLLNASGYVVPQRKSALASKVTGRLIWLGVEEGSSIRKDQVIARLENLDVSASKDQAVANVNVARFSLEQAQAELRDATLSFNRSKELLSRGVIAQQTYDDALARYEKAIAATETAEAALKANIAALKGAEVLLEYTLIRAPFDAVVLTKDADVGDIVTPLGAAANAKAAVVTIADMDSLQVEADVSESDLRQVKAEQPCEIQLDAIPGKRFRGVVHMLVPTVDRSKATVLVKVRFLDRDSRILPDMSAKVAFPSRPVNEEEKMPRTAIHQASLLDKEGIKKVFTVKGDEVVETPVSLGKTMGDMVEVLGGVQVGDQIVLNPPVGLRNGSKIKIIEK